VVVVVVVGMEDRIMKSGSPILKCHMYLPSVQFDI